MLEVNKKLSIPENELQWDFVRSSGPGGQNVNKVNSKAVLRWNVQESSAVPEPVRERFVSANQNQMNQAGEIVLSSQRFRDQHRNVSDCRDKLRSLLLDATHVPKKRKRTKPSKRQKERRLQAKRQHSEKKQRRQTHFD